MTDAQWIEKVSLIEDPIELLELVYGFPGTLGDPYYRDLEMVLFNQIEKVIEIHKGV